MKKVYLVYATLFYQDGNRTKFVINAFLSLSKAQCERFEANRIAEEKRNYELTKKYNLLEFV